MVPMKISDYLSRQTVAGNILAIEYWAILSTKERIEFLEETKSASQELLLLAYSDSNPLIRMIAAKKFGVLKVERSIEPTQFTAPLVKAAIASDLGLIFSFSKVMETLTHSERVVAICLSESVDVPELVAFIRTGVESSKLSENEAREILGEVCNNPLLLRRYSDNRMPEHGLDWYSLRTDFESVWTLTIELPDSVSKPIAWSFPMASTVCEIPKSLLSKMRPATLQVLAYRQYQPLLDLLKEVPDKFPQSIHDDAKLGK